jgi:hypothetical protein
MAAAPASAAARPAVVRLAVLRRAGAVRAGAVRPTLVRAIPPGVVLVRAVLVVVKPDVECRGTCLLCGMRVTYRLLS